MSSFLTLEDVNGCFFNGTGFFHRIDTSEIGTGDFTDVKLDFCIVGHSGNSFTFEVVNNLWTGVCYCLDANDDLIASGSVSYSNGTVTVSSSSDSVQLYLYCTNIADIRSYKYVTSIPTDLGNYLITREEVGDTETIHKQNLSTGNITTATITLAEGVNTYSTDFYYVCLIKKTDLVFNCTQTLTVGKVNTVRLNVDSKYLPGGALIGSEDLTIHVTYGDTIVTAVYDSALNDYVFTLDLTGKTDDSKVKLTVSVDENYYVNSSDSVVRLNSRFISVSSFSDLINEVLSGTEIISLANNVKFLSRISISHSLIIYGNGHTINLNGYGFNLLEDNTFKLINASCNNANTMIIQGINSKAELTDCTFTNCQSNNYNNLGSIVYCDVDIESLSDVADFTTNITDCEFYDNHSCLFHGGSLTVTGCKLHNTDADYVEMNNPAFIYQTDGEATIINSIFDIDYTSDTLCTNQLNVGFGQALVHCGESAIVNGADSEYLGSDEKLPFFTAPYSNLSHVFAKYYYSPITACVYTSPLEDKEDKCVCYSVTGSDFLFKEGVQVTRVDAGTQNETRKIVWE